MTLEQTKAGSPGGADGWFLLLQRLEWVGERGILPVGTSGWFDGSVIWHSTGGTRLLPAQTPAQQMLWSIQTGKCF